MAPAMSAVSAWCVTELTELAAVKVLAFAVSMASAIGVKPPGCNSLEALEEPAYVLPPTPNATGCTEHKHCLRLGTVLRDTNSLLHSHTLGLHHFRSEVKQNPASERVRD
ncbi:Hypothetical predicted protein [Xyrichtys novacula]|uniref:Secreted protein n=1 Tax=Xyrichtys novacula TaxID=13765 RepID=A0AAV1G6A6_XYRNO|nr:Hypothetical predicted protein [Xyrichtys novacula]